MGAFQPGFHVSTTLSSIDLSSDMVFGFPPIILPTEFCHNNERLFFNLDEIHENSPKEFTTESRRWVIKQMKKRS